MLSHSSQSISAVLQRRAVDSIEAKLNTRLLIAVFCCGIFEGAFRKWLLPEDFPELSYFAYLWSPRRVFRENSRAIYKRGWHCCFAERFCRHLPDSAWREPF